MFGVSETLETSLVDFQAECALPSSEATDEVSDPGPLFRTPLRLEGHRGLFTVECHSHASTTTSSMFDSARADGQIRHTRPTIGPKRSPFE